MVIKFNGQISMESQPQNPEFRNNPEKLSPMITRDNNMVTLVSFQRAPSPDI